MVLDHIELSPDYDIDVLNFKAVDEPCAFKLELPRNLAIYKVGEQGELIITKSRPEPSREQRVVVRGIVYRIRHDKKETQILASIGGLLFLAVGKLPIIDLREGNHIYLILRGNFLSIAPK